PTTPTDTTPTTPTDTTPTTPTDTTPTTPTDTTPTTPTDTTPTIATPQIQINVIGFGGNVSSNISPLDIVFAIDSSSSMEETDPDNLRLESASAFVQSMNFSRDQAAVISWDQGIDFATPFSSNLDEVLSSISSVDSGGSTDLGIGLQEAVRITDTSTNPLSSKVIIFLSDGNTEVEDSPVDLDTVIQEAKEKNYKIFSIGLGYEAGEVDLRKMANETGGRFYSTPEAVNLQEIFSSIFTTIIESTAPKNVDLVLTTNENEFSSIIPNSFNYLPNIIKDLAAEQKEYQWLNISSNIGNGDSSLSADEVFSLLFDGRSVLDTAGGIPPLIIGNQSHVKYTLPNGDLKVTPIPSISISDNTESPVENIYLSPDPSDSILKPTEMQTVDQIAAVIAGSNPSISFESAKNVIEGLALQTYNKGGSVQDALNGILEQVTQDINGRVANTISNLASRSG
ncbi:MAG: VWA domain-containing protein, partial [Candidatus Nitrosocosmicus sp.]